MGPREEHDKFYDIDRMLFESKVFGGVNETEADPDAYRIKIDDEEILKTDHDYFEHFRNCKTAFLKLSEKVSITKHTMEKTYNQSRAMEAMMRYTITHYE